MLAIPHGAAAAAAAAAAAVVGVVSQRDTAGSDTRSPAHEGTT